MSDFGFGSRKEAALQLVESFVPTYWLKQMRVSGDDLRVLRAHPGTWQVGTYQKYYVHSFAQCWPPRVVFHHNVLQHLSHQL